MHALMFLPKMGVDSMKEICKKVSRLLVLLLVSGATSVLNAASQEIIFWHSWDGPLGEKFEEIVQAFNNQPENLTAGVKVVTQNKGNYETVLEAGLAAVGTPNAPHIMQVYEMGNLVMQRRPNAYVSLDKLTDKPSQYLKAENFIPPIRAFYKSRNGETGLPSLPFNATTVVMFYNKDALKAAGLDPDQPPVTWEEFEEQALTLRKKGNKGVLASAVLSSHHIDQLGAWHNLPVATQGNGVDGNDAKLVVNSPFFVNHLHKLATWYDQGIFTLDVGPAAEKAFGNGDVVFITHGANRLSTLEKLAEGKFNIGVAKFPYWKSVVSKPQNTIAGGSSFWALSGHCKEDYQVIQRFFEYLASPELQAKWHQETSYIPVVRGVQAIAEKNHFYEDGVKGQSAKLALESYMGRSPTLYSRGILLPQFPKIREVMIQEIKEAVRGHKTPQEALERMEIVGNQIMLEENMRNPLP